MNVPKVRWTIATVCWMGLIFYLSSLSGEDLDKQIHIKPISWIGHVFLFAVLAAFLQLAVRGWNVEVTLNWAIAVAIFSSLFGVSDEYHQSFISGRHASVTDAVIDSISSTVTAILMWGCERLVSFRRHLEQ